MDKKLTTAELNKLNSGFNVDAAERRGVWGAAAVGAAFFATAVGLVHVGEKAELRNDAGFKQCMAQEGLNSRDVWLSGGNLVTATIARDDASYSQLKLRLKENTAVVVDYARTVGSALNPDSVALKARPAENMSPREREAAKDLRMCTLKARPGLGT